MPNVVEIAQNLIQIDTTNPPGHEAAAIAYIKSLLDDAGIANQVLARQDDRPNLTARLPGAGKAAPLLLYGHVDVVSTANQTWRVPPFEGRIDDGYLWGRGALDMKGPLSLFIAALLEAKAQGITPPGDVIFCALADEEVEGEMGARYITQQHPSLFDGVNYAFGEFGAFPLSFSGVRFYPIMISEKQTCWMRVTLTGPGGHASMPVQNGSMAQLSRVLHILDRKRLPVRITAPVRLMIDSLANALPWAMAQGLRALLNPRLTDVLLDRMGENAALFSPLLHNTLCPTMLHAAEKINIIPSAIQLDIDGRMLPGVSPEEMLAETRALLGLHDEVEVVFSMPGPKKIDMGLFAPLSNVLRKLDPQAVPIPYVMAGVTDARYFAQLRIQTYGFTPLSLPDDFNFIRTIHAANERVPVSALEFGVQAVLQAIQSVF